MRVLVTGGAGFIGSHLCEKLLAKGHEVICLDNFFTGRKKNLDALLDHHDFELVRHDVVEPILLEVDRIFHLACPASPVHYQFNPVKTVKTSVMGTINMLGLAKRTGARLLHASTSEVYGDPKIHPQKEDYWGNVNPVGPRACYDEGKRVAETLCFDYHRQHQVEIRVIRIFNTYGPRMLVDDGRVVSNFIWQALRDEPLTLFGDGSQTRSFCYVDDLVAGMLKMANHDALSGPVNLGNPDEFTVRQLAELVIELTGSKSVLEEHPLPQDDPTRRRPDITLAKEELDWSPTIPLKLGLDKTIAYFDDLLRSGSVERVRMRYTHDET
jgi:UDP-glucuronate decarboxylase